jgi:hypothetical protein
MAVNLGSLTPRLREQARQHKQSIREEAVAQTETKIANACQRLWREGKKPSAKQVAHLRDGQDDVALQDGLATCPAAPFTLPA